MKMRPQGGTCRAHLLDEFGRLLFGDEYEEREEEDEVEDEDGRRGKRKRKMGEEDER